MRGKKDPRLLTIALTLALGAGCNNAISVSLEDGVFSYNLDELIGGVFNSLSPTMTLNEWFDAVTPWSYDSWSKKVQSTQRENEGVYESSHLLLLPPCLSAFV